MKKAASFGTVAMLFLALVVLAPACQPQGAPATPAPAPTPPTPIPAPPAPSPPAPEPTPSQPPPAKPPEPLKPPEVQKPPETEKSPAEIMNWLACDVPDVQVAMLELTSKHPLEPHEGVITNKLAGGMFGMGYIVHWIPAVCVSEAEQHIRIAYSLVKDKRLPGETTTRDVSVQEIALEVSKAFGLLNRQVDDSFLYQEKVIMWYREHKDPEINTEYNVLEVIKHWDHYRQRVLKVIAKLEFILSYCPGHKQTGGSI